MLLKDKKGIIFGVADRRSIAWAVAQKFSEEGASFFLSYQNEKMGKRAKMLASKLPHCTTIACDVLSQEQLEHVFQTVKEKYGHIDFIVHSIAFAPAKELKGPFTDVSREGFLTTLEISAFSLTAIIQKALPLMNRGASVTAMSSLGGWRIVPNYHVMGVAKSALESSVRYLAADLGPKNIRINAISPGPIKTLSAMGIRKFSKILQTHKDRSPMRRNVKTSEVANTALFLASDLSENVTGEIIFTDSGYHVIGI
jgi:enoyl-[acyl-carrier protein] reductase I